jgi:acyl-ACP thioesterase
MSEEDAFATIDKRWLTKRFTFQGQDIDLVWSCGLFITMNPGLLKKKISNIFLILSSRLCRSY